MDEYVLVLQDKKGPRGVIESIRSLLGVQGYGGHCDIKEEHTMAAAERRTTSCRPSWSS